VPGGAAQVGCSCGECAHGARAQRSRWGLRHASCGRSCMPEWALFGLARWGHRPASMVDAVRHMEARLEASMLPETFLPERVELGDARAPQVQEELHAFSQEYARMVE